ncbi:hypothetical protein [Streptomyces sp. NPDC004721]
MIGSLHRRHRAVERDIRSRLADWNEHRRPFVVVGSLLRPGRVE